MSHANSSPQHQIGWFSLDPHDFGIILTDAVYRIEFRQFPDSTDTAEVLVQNGIVKVADLGLQNAVGRSLAECLTIWRRHFPQMTMKRTLLRAPNEDDVQYWIINNIPVEVVLYSSTDVVRDLLHQHMMPNHDYKFYVAATVNLDPDDDSQYEGQIWTDDARPGETVTREDMLKRMYQHLQHHLSDKKTRSGQRTISTPVLTVNTAGQISTIDSNATTLHRWLDYYAPSANALVFYPTTGQHFCSMTPATARRYVHILRRCEWVVILNHNDTH